MQEHYWSLQYEQLNFIFPLWRVDLGQLLDNHPAIVSVLILNKTEEKNKMKMFMGQDKNREIIYLLPSEGKQTQFQEN